MLNFTELKKALAEINGEYENRRSAWGRGVAEYTEELFESLEENAAYYEVNCSKDLEKAALNGATNWSEYSWGGCSLIYDYDIAKRLCNPSELKRTKDGERRPNSNEEWLDTQARALKQAMRRIKLAYAIAK